MRTRHDLADPRTRGEALPARRSPDAVPERILALQRTIGNASLSRVLGSARLQRLRKEDEEKHITSGYVIEGLEHYRSLLLPTQARWNEYHFQEYLLNRLAADVDPHIAQLKVLRAGVEAEDDPAAKIKEANAVAKKALDALKQINSEGQEADQKAVSETFDKGTAERKSRLTKELSSRKAALAAEALEQQAQAAALATQTAITNTGVVPNAVGRAFTRPNNATGRDDLHTWITLSWKPFRNLPRPDLDNVNCFVYHLTLSQLNDLMGRLGDETVATYDYQGWPATRAPLAATAPGLVMPVQLASMSARISAEVFVDWVLYNPGHTGPAKNLSQSFSFTADETKFTSFGGQIDTPQGRKVYRYNTGRRLIVNDSRDTVITYYEGNG